ncbi:hypothetical protein [Ammoniphilus sp. CFH 90114]|uniref:hypothetical protein n=1 Tax=Ammoniphilus sp. CFH 90114 TaxID=2493665 RepID=UPI00100F92FF|nr:hypothetical protein [Ammoniphilus sp. CFH 90114]RXT05744.1 hypothetical protein EIZ39_16685 [Ammoniphilus sp. CFH 90114]
MSRTTINILYIAFLVVMTLILPLLLLWGTGGSLEGIIAAVLSFGTMASYLVYTLILGARNS